MTSDRSVTRREFLGVAAAPIALPSATRLGESNRTVDNVLIIDTGESYQIPAGATEHYDALVIEDGGALAIGERGGLELRERCPLQAVAGADDRVNLEEAQEAINWWAEGNEIPHTGGETLSLTQIQAVIDAWATDGKPSCS